MSSRGDPTTTRAAYRLHGDAVIEGALEAPQRALCEASRRFDADEVRGGADGDGRVSHRLPLVHCKTGASVPSKLPAKRYKLRSLLKAPAAAAHAAQPEQLHAVPCSSARAHSSNTHMT